MKGNILGFAGISLLIIFSTLPAVAQTVNEQQLPTNLSIGDVLGRICGVVNWIFTALIVFVVIFVLVAAFKYLTAGGEAEKITSANHQLIYAAIALAVGIFAKVIPTIIATVLAGPGQTFTGC